MDEYVSITTLLKGFQLYSQRTMCFLTNNTMLTQEYHFTVTIFIVDHMKGLAISILVDLQSQKYRNRPDIMIDVRIIGTQEDTTSSL